MARCAGWHLLCCTLLQTSKSTCIFPAFPCFCKKTAPKALQVLRKCVPLQPLSPTNGFFDMIFERFPQIIGSLAQLNRASDYGSEGYRFESYRSHSLAKAHRAKMNGSLAQLNRASDYGSEGYRFESYRSHSLAKAHRAKMNGSLAQLNRASDYGSEGYRFESYRSHILGKSYPICFG